MRLPYDPDHPAIEQSRSGSVDSVLPWAAFYQPNGSNETRTYHGRGFLHIY
jgi:hypothetical protein